MENKRKELKTILLIALLGALWGALEIVFGNILHSMKFPFRGVIMSCMGMLVVSIGYFSNPKPGTCVCIGLIAAFLKFFSMGAFKLNPVLGITLEALAAELIFSLGGKKVATVYIVFIINSVITVFQNFITTFLITGITPMGIFNVFSGLFASIKGFVISGTYITIFYLVSKLLIAVSISSFAAYISIPVIEMISSEKEKSLVQSSEK